MGQSYHEHSGAEYHQHRNGAWSKIREWSFLIAAVLFGLGWWNSETKSTTNVISTVESITKTVSEIQQNQGLLTQRINDMDIKGTQSSQNTVKLETERNNEQDRRINIVEEQLKSVVPDVREIKTKLDFIANLLDERKKVR
jgi:hypothetical protein